MNLTVAFAEDLRRYTAAVLRAAAVYRAEQEGIRNRFNARRECLTPGCHATHKSQTGLCKEHR